MLWSADTCTFCTINWNWIVNGSFLWIICLTNPSKTGCGQVVEVIFCHYPAAPRSFYDKMMKPAFLFDGRNMLDHSALVDMGFEVHALGKGQISRGGGRSQSPDFVMRAGSGLLSGGYSPWLHDSEQSCDWSWFLSHGDFPNLQCSQMFSVFSPLAGQGGEEDGEKRSVTGRLPVAVASGTTGIVGLPWP